MGRVLSFRYSLFIFGFIVSVGAISTLAETVEGFATTFENRLVNILDASTGQGTDQLALEMEALSQTMVKRITEIPKGALDSIVRWDAVRTYYQSLSPDGKAVPIYVANYPEAIRVANQRLQREGIDFITIVQAPNAKLPDFDAPLPSHAAGQKKLAMLRTFISPPLAAIGGAFGGQFHAPAIASGLAGAGLETQFIWLSSKWARFWHKYKFPGNLAVNAGYCVAVTAVASTVEYLMTGAVSMNVKEFLTKSLFMGTATFVASFGAMQLASARLKANGAFSEYPRFKLETWSVLFANFGRLMALGTAGIGLEHSVFSLYGINFNPGDLIGWGIQGVYLLAVTLPMWTKLVLGDKALDSKIRANFDRASGLKLPAPEGLFEKLRTGCGRFLAGLTRIYSVKRL